MANGDDHETPTPEPSTPTEPQPETPAAPAPPPAEISVNIPLTEGGPPVERAIATNPPSDPPEPTTPD